MKKKDVKQNIQTLLQWCNQLFDGHARLMQDCAGTARLLKTLIEENKSLREQLHILGDCCEKNAADIKSLNKTL